MNMQISSGQGPQECQYAVGMLLQSFMEEYADITIISKREGNGKNCYTSVIFHTDEDLSDLEGSILWVCKSPYRPNHGRKNWYIDVSIVPEAKEIPKEEEYRVERFHSGGHGGQNVNKVETGVRICHIPTGITVTCTEERSQYLNKVKAIERINMQLRLIEEEENAKCSNMAWREHNRIIRGNPVRVYEGLKFIRKK